MFRIRAFLNLVIVNWNTYHSYKVIMTSKFWGGGGGGGGGDILAGGGNPSAPPLCMKPCMLKCILAKSCTAVDNSNYVTMFL